MIPLLGLLGLAYNFRLHRTVLGNKNRKFWYRIYRIGDFLEKKSWKNLKNLCDLVNMLDLRHPYKQIFTVGVAYGLLWPQK